MIITIIGKHPISNNPTSTTLSVVEMDFDFNNSIYREKIENNGRKWKLYKLLEDVMGFARFHSDENDQFILKMKKIFVS